MFALKRKAVQSAARVPAATARGVRRYASGQGDHGQHSGPKEEALGTQLYIVLATIPLAIGVYTISRPSEDGRKPGLSRVIDKYSQYKEQWKARNTLHTSMIEQAAFDRNLFQSSPGSAHVDLRFPEIFNTGSPFNVVAGQGARDMDRLVTHYERLNAETVEKQAKAAAKKES